jgi:hypothetical protein
MQSGQRRYSVNSCSWLIITSQMSNTRDDNKKTSQNLLNCHKKVYQFPYISSLFYNEIAII